MSHTPIYDQLHETRPSESTADVPAARRATLRPLVPRSEAGTVDDLSTRRGLGGRHRRPVS